MERRKGWLDSGKEGGIDFGLAGRIGKREGNGEIWQEIVGLADGEQPKSQTGPLVLKILTIKQVLVNGFF